MPSADWLVSGSSCWVSYDWILRHIPQISCVDSHIPDDWCVPTLTYNGARYLALEDFVFTAAAWLHEDEPLLHRLLASAWNSSCAVQDRYKLKTLQDFVCDLRQLEHLGGSNVVLAARTEMINRNELKVGPNTRHHLLLPSWVQSHARLNAGHRPGENKGETGQPARHPACRQPEPTGPSGDH